MEREEEPGSPGAGRAAILGRAALRLVGRAARGVGWLGRHELGLLVALLVAAAALWGAAELADEVLEGDTREVDERLLLLLRDAGDRADPIGPPWIEEMMRDFTALGGVGVLTAIAVVVGGYLLLRGAHRTFALMVVTVAGGFLVSFALKGIFGRPRPDLVPHGSIVHTASFPSGHSMLAAVTYLTLAVMLAGIESSRVVKAYLLLVALLLAGVVGVSRVYLGVHWPTDVLAGWAIGLAWALACYAAARALKLRGRLEVTPQEAAEIEAERAVR